MKLPQGFLAAGVNAGLKTDARDLGVIVADRPCALAACLTQNRCRAHSVNRAHRLLQAGGRGC